MFHPVSHSSLTSAVNIAIQYVNQHPLEQVELFFRRGTYRIETTGEQASIHLKNFKPINNGRLILAGQGKTLRFTCQCFCGLPRGEYFTD